MVALVVAARCAQWKVSISTIAQAGFRHVTTTPTATSVHCLAQFLNSTGCAQKSQSLTARSRMLFSPRVLLLTQFNEEAALEEVMENIDEGVHDRLMEAGPLSDELLISGEPGLATPCVIVHRHCFPSLQHSIPLSERR